MAERKPDFTYIYSETLKQEIAMSKKTKIVYCADGVKYSFSELEFIRKADCVLPVEIHLIKKIFEGSEIKNFRRLPKYEIRQDADNKGECDEKSNKENCVDFSNSGDMIPQTSGSGAGSPNGYYDLY